MTRRTPPRLMMILFTLLVGGVTLLSLHPGVVHAENEQQAETSTETSTETATPTPSATPTVTMDLTASATVTQSLITQTASTVTATPTMTATLLPGENSPTPAGEVSATVVLPSRPRQKTMLVDYTAYLWWIVHRESNQVLCELSIEHQDPPTSADIFYGCGEVVYDKWTDTEECDPSLNNGESTCNRLYTYLVKKFSAQKETTLEVAPPTAWLSLDGCIPAAPTNPCKRPPSLVIIGEEQMEGERIIKIHGLANGVPFECLGEQCIRPLPTRGESVRFEFWVDSSLGDSSRHFSALVRVLPVSGVGAGQPTPTNGWVADVASSQWRDSPPPAACAQTWESLPEVGGPPEWLSNTNEIETLKSHTSYYYLAGQLIRSGQVDTKECSNNGMQTIVIANECGLQKASSLTKLWQNQFDVEIINVAAENHIPAQLMKNIISRESQFWPGVYNNEQEVGLGQMTEGGADTLLMWNPAFFNEFCPSVFTNYECSKGYNNFPLGEQNLLKGALLNKVNASCSYCLAKVDLDQARFSIDVFASSLQASCEQTGQIIYNITGKAAGVTSTYNDLWKLTLVNYNAGSGCLHNALVMTKNLNQPFTWENVTSHLEPACLGAIHYVQDITNNKMPGPDLN